MRIRKPGKHGFVIHRFARMIMLCIGGLGVVVIGFIVFLLAVSPGRPSPVLDSDGRPVAGSISQKIFVEINGVEQGMFIRTRNPENPVLLYVHGGMPDSFLEDRYPTGLEDIFTVSVNLAGLPGLSLPCGFDRGGLPIGLQIIGRPFDEETTLRVGHAYEQSTEWPHYAPEVTA